MMIIVVTSQTIEIWKNDIPHSVIGVKGVLQVISLHIDVSEKNASTAGDTLTRLDLQI